MKTIMALIPARGGSKRIPKKNIRSFFGHALIAYTIAQAKAANIFKGIYVSTDDEETALIASVHGARAFDRPKEYATDVSPDYEWVNYTLNQLGSLNMTDCFMLLRPTNPFRKPESIIRAWKMFQEYPEADSMRAIRRAKEHPAKMWWKIPSTKFILNYGYSAKGELPKYERQTASLPEVFVQSAALEIFKKETVAKFKNISGELILPFHFPEFEDFDINTEEDWILAEELVKRKMVELQINDGPECSKFIDMREIRDCEWITSL